MDDDGLHCPSCGAVDGVEETDARLPLTTTLLSTEASPPRPVHLGLSAPPTLSTISPNDEQPESERPEAGLNSVRVESVSVVAVQQPDSGGLLLRVLPNLGSQREATHATTAASVPHTDADEAEDAEVPPEPACSAFTSRLKTECLCNASPDLDCGFCVICAEEFPEAGTPVVALSCGHTFHEDCLRQWLTRRHTCPTCRLVLEVDNVRYLRSIGMEDEAAELEKIEQERQAKEEAKQAASRRRWVDSMRRGDPVHFGLTCGRCSMTPLTGDCYRCECCEAYVLCNECYMSWKTSSQSDDDDAGGDDPAVMEGSHPSSHSFTRFGGSSLGPIGVPSGPGSLLTVLMPTSAPPENANSPEEGATEAAFAAAEVAFAAVRSLALAPLAAGQGGLGSAGSTSGMHSSVSPGFNGSTALRQGGRSPRR